MPTTRLASRTRPQPSITIPCPVHDCPFLLPLNKPKVIQTHLTDAHTTEEISCVPTSFYSNALVHKCPICPPQKLKLYKSNRTLTNHMASSHATSTRTSSNLDLITTTFTTDPIHSQQVSSNWTQTLKYLHRTDLIPFSFRRSLYYKTPIKLRQQLQNMLYKIVETLVSSHCTHIHANSPQAEPYLTSPTAFWKLLLTFEGTLLAPASPTEPKKHDTLIKHRINQFLEGKFDYLHRSALQRISPPNTNTPNLDQRKDQILKAANNDDWRKASSLLQAPLPPVSYNEEFLPKIQDLHPPPTSYTPTQPLSRPNPTLHQQAFTSSNDMVRARLHDDTLLLSTLRRLKRDKSSGPFADSTDFLKDTFLVRAKTPNQKEERYPNIDLLSTLLNLLYEGKTPKEVRQYISANESVAFHKDPSNLNNIRPIGIGTALRRIAATHAMAATKDMAADFLSPNQFAIGLSSGMDVITQTMQSHASRYLLNPANTHSTPSRAILILDLKNMFNSVSMVKSREILHANFPHLLPLFDVLYYDDTRCWYRQPDGQRQFILRREGSSQGCPFAAFLACLVLDDIIKKIDTELHVRATARRTSNCVSDDGLGTRAIVMSYIDDTTVSIGYQDLKFFLNRFNELGIPLGCVLKPQKCKIMTSTTGSSPMATLHHQHQQDLQFSLDKYCGGQSEGEITTGTRILGTPIGNTTFVDHFQNKKIQKLRTAIASIHQLVEDPHIAITLFKFSLQHYVTHLLPTDILHHQNTSTMPKHYATAFTKTINKITKHFIQVITTNTSDHPQSTLQDHAWYIATTPSGLGGLGFHDIEAKAIRTYTATLAQSIRTMKFGLRPQPIHTKPTLLHDTLIKLPTHLTSTFKGWKTSSLQIFQKYRTLSTQYFEGVGMPNQNKNNQQPYTLDTYTLQVPLRAATKQIQKVICIDRLKRIWPTLPKDIQKHFPSTFSTLTSIPLGQSTRTDTTNRFTADEFKVFLQRKLRLPLYPKPPKTCTCGNQIDKFGDHFFTCKHHAKIALHHRMRDSLYTICQQVLPLISDTTSDNIHLELPNIFDKATHLRPGDVVIKHPINSTTEAHQTTLIDVTLIAPYKINNTNTTFSETTNIMQKHHQTQEYKKFKINDHPSSNSTSEQLAQELVTKRTRMLPFTIDHHGMLGPIASEFLLGHENATFTTSPNTYENRSTSNEVKELIQLSMHKNRHNNILTKANKAWKEAYGTKWFTNTYHAQTPRQWAKQVIGNTFSIHSSKHIIKALNKINTTTLTPKKQKAMCSSINLRTPSLYTVQNLRYPIHCKV